MCLWPLSYFHWLIVTFSIAFQRCLHCPIAYHLSCIPPMARFHELALLCHEHAGTHKLPDLDIESSMQAVVEAKNAKKEAKVKKIVVLQETNDGEVNQFFPGVRGDELVADEDRLLLHLQAEAPDHDFLIEGLPFCLPTDVKNEVSICSVFHSRLASIVLTQCSFPSCLRFTLNPRRISMYIPTNTISPIGRSANHRVTASATASRRACPPAMKRVSTE